MTEKAKQKVKKKMKVDEQEQEGEKARKMERGKYPCSKQKYIKMCI